MSSTMKTYTPKMKTTYKAKKKRYSVKGMEKYILKPICGEENGGNSSDRIKKESLKIEDSK